MTREWMFLSPRKKDDYINQEYRIGVNSTGMIGLLLTKSPEESQFLEDIGPVTVLEDVGISWSAKRET
jgi:ATP adenylyltransferase/5',5'''-P-1,P-4-tetraphosphate phosphorylase II